MKTLSREEFERIYGANALNNLGQPKSEKRPGIVDAGIGFAKGLGESATETANMFVEGGRMIQAGLNPNETYGEMSQRLDKEADAAPAWVNPFSGQTEEIRRENLKSDNQAQMFGKGAAFGAEMMIPVTAAAKVLTKGDDAVNIVRSSMKKADIDTPRFPREKASSFINKYRAQLSDIDPQYETVLKQQENPDKMLRYFDVAEKSAVDPAAPMATTIASKRGVDAYEAVTKGMAEAGQMKGSLLDSIADVKIGGNIPGRSIDNVKSIIETRYGMTVDAQGNFSQVPGRIAKLDAPSQKLLKEYIQELRKLGQSPTARQLDDWVDKMQANLYKQSSPNLFSVADDPVISFLKGQTGEINGQLKNNVDAVLKSQGKDPAYGALNDQYARLIRTQQDLNKALGTEGDKGAGLMKSLFSPQTGEKTRRLFQTIQDETGINLFEEATLAKFAMESVGDPRSKSLLKQLDIMADKTSEFDLTKPGSWIKAGREAVDLDGKKLGEQLIKESTEAKAKVISPEAEKGLKELGERLSESSGNSITQNKQAGFFKLPFTKDIGAGVTPEKVAGLMDDNVFDGIAVALEDLPAARRNPAFNRFLDDMKLNKASDEELDAFLKEVTTEYEKVQGSI